MNRKWLAALIMVLGLHGNLPAQFQFVTVPGNVVTNFNTKASGYLGVATSGNSFLAVGSNSVASFANPAAPVAGGYLTNNSAWTSEAVTNN